MRQFNLPYVRRSVEELVVHPGAAPGRAPLEGHLIMTEIMRIMMMRLTVS